MSRPGAIVLCGGKSQRMGRPKAWLPFGPGEVLLQRVLRLLSGVASPIVVVAAPGQELPRMGSHVIVARDNIAHRGPLQGLGTGLRALPEDVELVYATATDVPFLRPTWVEELAALIEDFDLVIPDVDGFLQPLAALYRRATVQPTVDALLRESRLRPIFLLETLRARVVTEEEVRTFDPDLSILRNVNTPEDYRRALRDAGLAAGFEP